MHAQALFCRQLVGKVQGRARNEGAVGSKAMLYSQGLALDLLPILLI